ncbi:hypothetical protein EBZ39_15820, partial [bacterium]|nr:hypothetical protein [bacterium]
MDLDLFNVHESACLLNHFGCRIAREEEAVPPGHAGSVDDERLFDFVARTTDDATGRCVVSIPGKGDVEYGYLLQTCMPFRDARAVKSSLDRNRYLWQLGEILRAIQSVVVTGFGTEFDEGIDELVFRYKKFVHGTGPFGHGFLQLQVSFFK